MLLTPPGSQTDRSQMWGKTAINSDQTMTDYEQQQPDRAVKNIKDVLSAYKYHQIQAVNDILVRQANRVGAMFRRMENDYLAKNYPGYEKIGLQTLWTSWIKGRTDRARTRAETYMKDGVKRLHDGYGSDYNRQFTDPVLLAKIDSLTTAVNGQQSWANPF